MYQVKDHQFKIPEYSAIKLKFSGRNSQSRPEENMIKLSTFLVLLLAVNYFTTNGSSIRENAWSSKHGTGSSGSNRGNGHLNGWSSRHGSGASGFNPGNSNSNNGHGYNDGSPDGSGFNSG